MKYKYNNQWKDLTVKAGDTLPIGTIVDYDGETVPAGYEEVEETEDYSTSETNTGKKWIDGKPIYRKVITGNVSDGSIAHGLSDVNFVNAYGYFIANSGAFMPLPTLRVNYNNYSVGLYVTATNIMFDKGTDAAGTVYITLEYTKTTN